MALNTPVPIRQVGNTTEQLISKKSVAKQILVDTAKNTVVVMDGKTYGGHPLAKEAVKIKSASPNLKINGGTIADLSGDITITVLPGYMATGFEFVENPEGEPEGKYLKITYSDDEGGSSEAYVNAALLVDTYSAGDGIVISGENVISVDPAAISAGAFAAEDGGLEVTDDGKLKLSLGPGLKIENGQLTLDIETGGLLTMQDGKLVLGSVVSADFDNILAEGSDKGAYMPGDLGSLEE